MVHPLDVWGTWNEYGQYGQYGQYASLLHPRPWFRHRLGTTEFVQGLHLDRQLSPSSDELFSSNDT